VDLAGVDFEVHALENLLTAFFCDLCVEVLDF
jgi:hypothetical protein